MANVSFSEWKNLDLRVGRIISAENHPNADKLYVIKVNVGEKEPRTIVSGLREHYTPDELKGKNIIVIVNLEPAVLRGVKSEGMLLAASHEEKCVLLEPDQDIEVGSKVT